LDVGGFCEDYLYGYEDVDCCITYLSKLKKVSLSANELSLVHDEGSTQKLDLSDDVRERRLNNQAVLQRRYGYAIKRAFRKDQVKIGRFWSGAPLTAAFAVTEAHENAKAGDYFTAMELAFACAEKLGWEVRFLARNQNWYDLDGVDVPADVVEKVPAQMAKTYHIVPIEYNQAQNELIVVLDNPENFRATDDLSTLMGFKVTAKITDSDALEKTLAKYYETQQDNNINELIDEIQGDTFLAEFEGRNQSIDLDELKELSSVPPPRSMSSTLYSPEGRSLSSGIQNELLPIQRLPLDSEVSQLSFFRVQNSSLSS